MPKRFRVLFALHAGVIGAVLFEIAIRSNHPGTRIFPLWPREVIQILNLPALIAGVAFGRLLYLVIAFQWFLIGYAVSFLFRRNTLGPIGTRAT